MTEQGSERRRIGADTGAGAAPRPESAPAGGAVPGIRAAAAFGRV